MAAWQRDNRPPPQLIDLVLGNEDEEEEYDDEEYDSLDDLETTNDLGSIGKSRKVQLNLKSDYVTGWGCREAFREIYQNWRDAILRSSKIKERDFRPQLSESKRTILVQVFHPVSQNLLGYIRFQYDTKEMGTLEMTNFHANLELDHLSIGSTSKAHDAEQAGQHGEGMKLACLVFRRHGYGIRILSSGFTWNFLYDKFRSLNCHLSRLGVAHEEAKRVSKNVSTGVQRSACPNGYMDVSVKIGFKSTGRDRMGVKRSTNKSPLASFRNWMEISLDLQAPGSITRTVWGDVLLDEAQSNKLYLRGLLLPHGSSDGRQLRYGYNFLRGETSRDRTSLLNTTEEFDNRRRIWSAAIDENGDSALVTYTNLILQTEPEYADSAVADVWTNIGERLMTKVWHQMLKMNVDDGGRSAFYYDAQESTEEQIHVISQDLKKRPYPLKKNLWQLLRRFKLCRTPAEEQLHIFSTVQAIDQVPKTEFATHLDWMLDCCFKSHPATAGIDYEFVDAGDIDIDLSYCDSTWRIHNKWLTYDSAHTDAFCEEKAPAEDEPFFCDHVVLWLWDLVISGIIAKDSNGEVAKKYSWLKSMVSSRLAQMPRLIHCKRTSFKGELEVSWDCTYSEKNKDNPIRVTLHTDDCMGVDENCWDHPSQYLFRDEEQDEKCECVSQVSTVSSTSVTFTNLDSSKKQYAKVSLDRNGAFFGLVPKSVSPYAEDLIKTEARDTVIDPNPSTSVAFDSCCDLSDDSSVGEFSISDEDGEIGQGNDMNATNTTALSDNLTTATTNDDDDDDDNNNDDIPHRDSTRTLSPSKRLSKTQAASSRPDPPKQAVERRAELEIEGRRNAKASLPQQNGVPQKNSPTPGQSKQRTDSERNNPVSNNPVIELQNDDQLTEINDGNQIVHQANNGNQESSISIIRQEPTISGHGIYHISTPVSHRDLNWESGFPGTHDFFRTASDPNTFIAKPKNPPSSSTTTTTTTTTITTTTTTTTSIAPDPPNRKHPRSPNSSPHQPPNKRPRTQPP